MRSIDVAIVGAGQAGLSMSRCLSVLGIDHVLFERGAVAERWKTTAWDSLRMLTPNWLNGLPWQPYDGGDPHGFMTLRETIAFLERYAARFRAPVLAHTPVLSLEAAGGRYRITTPGGAWRARAVVIATGHCDVAFVPPMAGGLSPSVASLHSSQYRAPSGLPEGGVLVVGASSSGLQIAQELRHAGREVTLAVGRHIRTPRIWRGHDIFWWLARLGRLGDRAEQVADLEAEIRQPAMQLVGRPDHADIDLASMQALGVRLVGRLTGLDGMRATFALDLEEAIADADARMARILESIDRFAGLAPESTPSLKRVDRSRCPAVPQLSLEEEGIRTIVWATGFRRAFPWIRLPVLRADGDILQRNGLTAMPGLYTLGFRFQRKRDSHFFGGVGTDALEMSADIANFLGAAMRQAA